jgi:type I protein arginine methyltransferase
MTTTYTVAQYGEMISCTPRMDAFMEALRRAVFPGATVIDIGAGTGIFSLLAVQFGAARVVAIEPASAARVLAISARDNNCSDRIEIHGGLSTDYHPDVRADVIISDLRGSLPLFEHHVGTIIDARERLLKPGGVLIAQRDTIRIALACHPDYAVTFDEPWSRTRFGLDLTAGRRFATNRQVVTTLQPEALKSAAADLIMIDYRTVASANQSGTACLVVEQSGTVNGFLLWFDCETADGLGFSNAPGSPRLVYQSSFFALDAPVIAAAGDMFKVTVSANLVASDYVWTWEVTWLPSGTAPPRPLGRFSTMVERALNIANSPKVPSARA